MRQAVSKIDATHEQMYRMYDANARHGLLGVWKFVVGRLSRYRMVVLLSANRNKSWNGIELWRSKEHENYSLV